MIDAVIISGAGRGIGREIALDFGKSGIPVVCISKSKNCEETANAIRGTGGTAESIIVDIGDCKKTKEIMSNWVSKTPYKKLGVILAAAILGPKGPITNIELAEWDECHKINILGNLAILNALLPKMTGNSFGRIITFAGGGSAYAFPTFPAYSATKTAMVRITENINEDIKNKGDFAIVCLAPGAVETDMLKEVRSSGAEVRTVVSVSETVTFAKEFINSSSCGFSGAFVHVRNNWKDYLNSNNQLKDDSFWKLRRIE